MQQPSNLKKKAFYAVNTLTSLSFLLAGIFKLMAHEQMVTVFTHFELPLALMYLVGVAEVLGAIALWIPRLTVLSALGLTLAMGGAFAFHFSYDPFEKTVPAIMLIACLVFIIKVRIKENKDFIAQYINANQ